jgi:tRNA-uridine 2-sulfurtransferase
VNTGKKKVFVGVSGGVDSSVALALLQEQGHDVTGVFLKVWHPDWLPCDWKEERRSAMRVCATLGVPFLTLDCEAEYKRDVADYMIREYAAGRVPNPDVFCNKYVKFGVFLEKALEMGADYIATGHYSSIREGQNSNDKGQKENTNTYELLESADKNKDQSYFLHTLNQHQLSHTLFPIGHLQKPEVRALAEKFGLPTATKKDSQGLCFIGKVDMKDFLSHYITAEKGNVLNTAGEVIGTHEGAIFFAIGQRHGFDVTKKTPTESRYFVVAKDLAANTITVAHKVWEGLTFPNQASPYAAKSVIIRDLHWITPRSDLGETEVGKVRPSHTETSGFACSARIRYRQEKQECVVTRLVGEQAEQHHGYRITFATPQEGVSVGQSAVLYDGDICLGGGIIEEVI